MRLWHRIGFLFTGTWFAGVLIVLVCARLAWVHFHVPRHFDEIAKAFGSTSLFYETPQVSQSGDQFTFVKTSAHGYALYLGNATTHQTRSLVELYNYLGQHGNKFELKALPWSPDDRSFLYLMRDKLVIFPSVAGQSSTELPVATNSVTSAAWLNPGKFFYIEEETNLFYAQKGSDGQWEQHHVLSRDLPLESAAWVGDESVAWLENNVICGVNVKKGTPMTNVLSVASPASDANRPPRDGLALWLDASTLRQPDQSPVTHLIDLGPRKNDAVENGNPPVFNGPDSEFALKGKGTIHFSSHKSITDATGLATRSAPGLIGDAPRSVFAVMRHQVAKSTMMVSMGDSRGKGTLFSIELTNFLYLPTGYRGADNRIKFVSTNWNVLEVVYDGITQSGYVNGDLKGTATAELDTVNKVVEIGLRTATPDGKYARSADGDFAELLIYDRALSEAERRQVEDYLGIKWFGIKMGKSIANPYVWLDPKTSGVTSFTYSRDTGVFLLNGAEQDGRFLSKFDSKSTSSKIAEADGFRNVQWLDGNGTAFIAHEGRREHIALTDSDGAEKAHLLDNADIRWFQVLPGGKKLLLLGTVSNEPSAGIWNYDIASRSATELVTYSDYPSRFARALEPIYKTVNTSDGRKLNCAIFRPANFSRHKRYPVLIGDTVFTDPIYRYQGPCWAPAIAECGGYVIIVERQAWFKGIENWSKDVKTAYEALEPALRVDRSRVYLFGASAETQYMGDLISKKPQLWKGVILLNPSRLPDFSESPLFQTRPKILISSGGEEDDEKRFREYQIQALQYGALVDYIISPGETHHFVGNASQSQRTKEIMDFVFDK